MLSTLSRFFLSLSLSLDFWGFAMRIEDVCHFWHRVSPTAHREATLTSYSPYRLSFPSARQCPRRPPLGPFFLLLPLSRAFLGDGRLFIESSGFGPVITFSRLSLSRSPARPPDIIPPLYSLRERESRGDEWRGKKVSLDTVFVLIRLSVI